MKAPKFSEWYKLNFKDDGLTNDHYHYSELPKNVKERLDSLIEKYIGELLLNQVIGERKSK